MNGKWRPEESPVFLLDRTFGRIEMATILRGAGFHIVTLYEEYGDAEAKIADPVMIYDCGFKERVLLSGDRDLIFTWAREIKEAQIAVFVTTDNNGGPKVWAPIVIQARPDILRELRRRTKPFTANIGREGRITQVRVPDGPKWRTIPVGKTIPSHQNKYKKNR
jgi:hypothetical protein